MHQQDIQAVLNALWSGGAEGIQMQDQRIIGTSAPRCVGNTLLLNGRTYSPPYTVTAVGDPVAMQAALAAAPLVTLYKQYVVRFGLGYSEEPRATVDVVGHTEGCGCGSPSPRAPSATEPPPTVEEICRRLDGMPLAIELAAARVRALSLDDIVGSLHDRFRLLTGGARTAVRRQQTLRASVDWSHALLTESEQKLFRRLAVFLGGFDLDAAQAVAGTTDVERYQVLDQLTLLVDKSLVVAENTSGRARYRLLETVRQYAQEKLGESGEAPDARARHRDHYTSVADVLNYPARPDYREHLQRIDDDIDNLRAAFGWSLEAGDTENALRLASSLFPIWQDGGRNGEGLAWLETALGQEGRTTPVDPAVHARSLMDRVMLVAWTLRAECLEESARALALAREVGDPALVIRGLIARGVSTYYDEELAGPCFAEAAELAQGLDDPWIWSQIYVEQARSALGAGDPVAVEDVAAKGLEVSTAISNHGATRVFHWAQGWARAWQGNYHAALDKLDSAAEEAAAAHDTMLQLYALLVQGFTRAFLGDSDGAHASADVALAAAADLIAFFEGLGYRHA